MEQLQVSLHEIFSKDHINVEHVIDALSAYKSNEADWEKFAIFDTHRYTRNLVDEGNGKFNLMLLAWGPGMGSSIHDHADAHCFVKILSGKLAETMYEWPTESAQGQAMIERCRNIYERDGVTYINDSMGLHRVENQSHTEAAVSLHLYIPPFKTCLSFDERTGQKRKVKVTFWSKYGERTSLKDKKPASVVQEASVESLM